MTARSRPKPVPAGHNVGQTDGTAIQRGQPGINFRNLLPQPVLFEPHVSNDLTINARRFFRRLRPGFQQTADDSLVHTAFLPLLRPQHGLLHQIVPRTEHGIVRVGALSDQLSPAPGHARSQLFGNQRQKEDRCFVNIRFRRGHTNQVVGRAFACRLQREVVVSLLCRLNFLRLKLCFKRLTVFRNALDPRSLARLDRAGKHSVQRVVVADGYRIKLVIVTPSTADRETQKSACHHIDLVVDHIVTVTVKHAAQRQQPHGGQLGRIVRQPQLIGSDLFPNKLIKGFVVIERPNDVVAIRVGEGPNPRIAIHQHAVFGVGISGYIQPVSSPAFSIPR